MRWTIYMVMISVLGLTGCITTDENNGSLAGKNGSSNSGSFQQEDLPDPNGPALGSEDSLNEADLYADKAGSEGEAEFATVYFGFDEITVTEPSRAVLEGLAERLRQKPTLKIQIQGHCDERGSTEYNLALGEKRAEAVRRYLVTLGVEPTQLATISYGEERPAAEGHTEADWANNRRAEFIRQSFSH